MSLSDQMREPFVSFEMAFSGSPEERCRAAVDAWRDERDRRSKLEALLNTPETADFIEGVRREAAHQRERWSDGHDAGKDQPDWFWLIGYLGGKALRASIEGDLEKARHHTISTAAALANWHLALSGADTSMRPGIAAAAEFQASEQGVSDG